MAEALRKLMREELEPSDAVIRPAPFSTKSWMRPAAIVSGLAIVVLMGFHAFGPTQPPKDLDDNDLGGKSSARKSVLATSPDGLVDNVLITSQIGKQAFLVYADRRYPLLFRFGDQPLSHWNSFDPDQASAAVGERVKLTRDTDEKNRDVVRLQFSEKFAVTVYLRYGNAAGTVHLPRTWQTDQWQRFSDVNKEVRHKLTVLTETVERSGAFDGIRFGAYSLLASQPYDDLVNEVIAIQTEDERRLNEESLSELEQAAVKERIQQSEELITHINNEADATCKLVEVKIREINLRQKQKKTDDKK